MSDAGWKQRVAGAVVALAVLSLVLLVVDSISGDPVDIETTGGETTTEDSTTDGRDPGRLVIGSESADESDPTGAGTDGEQVDGSADGRIESAELPEGVLAAAEFEPIRNRQDKFTRFAQVPSDQLDVQALTEPADRPSNGTSDDGQFRIACEYSHFNFDDPVIFPGQPGRSHLHMFFGNTDVDAFTTEDELINTGGGTCTGYELNRSAYWIPALLDGKGNAVVPETITIYYKTKFPDQAIELPQGLQMIAGNFTSESFEVSGQLFWSCGANGFAYDLTNRIPDCGGDIMNASIQFPNCWDGVNVGSDDFVSHLTFTDETEPCPDTHPKRLPQISMLFYWPGVDSVEGWRLSSDDTQGYNGPPGGTLHADWWGAWNDEAIKLWTDNCIRATQNCSNGQTGTPRLLAQLNGLNNYQGEHFLALP